MKRLLALAAFGLLLGCKGPKGDAGPMGFTGAAGQPATFTEFSGTISTSDFTITTGALTAKTMVTCYYALASFPNVFIEIGDLPNIGDPFSAIDYTNGLAAFFNMTIGDKYKVIIAKPAVAPEPTSQGIGSRLLD
jgi:hypothetical protein